MCRHEGSLAVYGAGAPPLLPTRSMAHGGAPPPRPLCHPLRSQPRQNVGPEHRLRTTQCTGSRRGRIAFVPRGVPTEPTETVVRRVAPDPKLLLLASGWRARAKEILLRAETMKDADARQEMREVAASYERLAQRVKQLSADADKA